MNQRLLKEGTICRLRAGVFALESMRLADNLTFEYGMEVTIFKGEE